LELIYVPTDDVIPYENNPRINDHAVEEMAAVIEKHGFLVPIFVHMVGDEIHMVDGHLRMKAAKQLGLAEMPAIDVSSKSEKEIAALRIATNRAAELADWDPALLVEQVNALNLEDDDFLGMTGFLPDELPHLPPEVPITPPTNTPTGETVNRSADPARVKSDTDMVNLTLRMSVADRREAQAALDTIQTHSNASSASDAALAAIRAMASNVSPTKKPKRSRPKA